MSQSLLNEIIESLDKMSPEQLAEQQEVIKGMTGNQLWVPNPGPQTEAYFSEADILLYGGEPGGGKTSLLLGLAFNCHQRSLIMRQQYTDLGHITEEAVRMNGSRQGYNGSPPPKLRRPDGRLIEFFAAAKPGDEQHRQGNPFDFLGVDEATQLSGSQILFLMGWMRSTTPGQRKRCVLATNPPLTAEGYWVIEWFAPWLDDRYPDPAGPGELRWAIRGEDDRPIWVDGPEPMDVSWHNELVYPKSYTYIPASLSDNPFLVGTDYEKQLGDLPNEVRRILLGGFKSTLRDQDNQAIPTEWIRLAQQRWTPDPPQNVPMCAMGVDATGGGDDPLVIAPRYDGWFPELIVVPGREIPMDRIGGHSAAQVISYRRDGAMVIVDMGGGYGGSMYETLMGNQVETIAHKGAEASTARTSDGKLRFTNKRTEVIWKFREALDPSQPGGSPISLPPDPEITADLSAPTFKITPQGIKAESKEDVVKRLGRSTDKGDAIQMSWAYGDRNIHIQSVYASEEHGLRSLNTKHKVVTGRSKARSKIGRRR